MLTGFLLYYPHKELKQVLGRIKYNSSPVLKYKQIKKNSKDQRDKEKRIRWLVKILEENVLPRKKFDESFPVLAQATVAALIDEEEMVTAILLKDFQEMTEPKNDREYLTMLYVVDVLQGIGDEQSLPFLNQLKNVEVLDDDRRNFIASHRAGVFELQKAAIIAEQWIKSGEKYPYYDWLAGWYSWFVTK